MFADRTGRRSTRRCRRARGSRRSKTGRAVQWELLLGNVSLVSERRASLLHPSQERLTSELRPMEMPEGIQRLQRQPGHGGRRRLRVRSVLCGLFRSDVRRHVRHYQKAGQFCNDLPPEGCEKCSGTLTCGSDTGPAGLVCCAPHATGCKKTSDCCTTGQANMPPPGQGIACSSGTCQFCAANLDDTCGANLPCCAGLTCVAISSAVSKCKQCVPETFVQCSGDVTTCRPGSNVPGRLDGQRNVLRSRFNRQTLRRT